MDLINSICYLLLAVLIVSISNASCSSISTAARMKDLPSNIMERPKRKASELDTSSSGALEYMTQLGKKYSDSEGRPVFEHEDDPTSIWCILDRDMNNKVYRPKPSTPAKCTVQNRFIFNWDSVTKGDGEPRLPVQKAILRAYLKPIRRLMKADPTTVDVNIEVRLLGEKTNYAAGNEQVQVTMSTSWLELEVTKGVSQLWPPTSSNYDLEFTVNLSVDCKTVKKVPAIFIDPTEIELSNARRRQRYESFQPLFLMFFNDAHIKEIVSNETATAENIEEPSEDEFPQAQSTNVEHRDKRSSPSPCRVADYAVVFTDLYLDYIISPFMYNAKQCVGSCSHHTLTEDHQLGNNHANIMAAAYEVFQNSNQNINGVIQTPRDPCCVPTRYSSRGLLINVGPMLEWKIYPAMRVEACGCR